MAIDVLDHIWVGVFSASYVAQCETRMREGRTPAIGDVATRIADEACAVADEALQAYRAVCEINGRNNWRVPR